MKRSSMFIFTLCILIFTALSAFAEEDATLYAAEQGDAIAQFSMGMRYYTGKEAQQDYAIAAEWFAKSAKQGYATAQANLGVLYLYGQGVQQDSELAVEWLEKSAEQGLIDAQMYLMQLNLFGDRVPQNAEVAYKWGLMAAEQGDVDAQYNIGRMLWLGEGTQQNREESIAWFAKAGEKGELKSQLNLGYIYLNGSYVPQDVSQSAYWYAKAAEQGDAGAQYQLALFYTIGSGVQKDSALAVKWFTAAAEQGHADAQANLCVMYKDGNGVTQDYKIASEWFAKSAENGNSNGQFNLGIMYYYGYGVKKDLSRAFEWMHQSAEQGLAKAQYNLGIMYESGEGVEKNSGRAKEWFDKAAKGGDPLAQAWMTLHGDEYSEAPAETSAALRLVPAQWIDENKDYTLTQSTHPITVTEEWLASMGATLADMSELGDVGLDTDTITAPMNDAASLLTGARVLSVSPDGSTLLAEMEGVPLFIRGDQIRAVSLDLTRCELSPREEYRYALALVQNAVLHKTGVGRAGVVWSPDGRYALINNATRAYQNMKNVYGMTWLDAEGGAAYMAQSAGTFRFGRPEDMGTLLAHACADEAAGAVYCTVYGRFDDKAALQLRRYAPGTASYESLTVLNGSMACEGMGWDAAGNLAFVMFEDKKEMLTTCSPETGAVTQTSLPRYTGTLYLTATSACTLLSMVTRDEARYPMQVFWKDEKLNRLIVDDGATVARLAILDSEEAPTQEGVTIVQASLSSDGTRVLLACLDESKAYRLYLMDTDTLALTSVDISAFADMLAEKGPGFGYDNNRFLPGLCFTGGDRYVLFPFANGDTVLCELVGD